MRACEMVYEHCGRIDDELERRKYYMEVVDDRMLMKRFGLKV